MAYTCSLQYKEPHLISSSKDREKQNDFEQFQSTFKDARQQINIRQNEFNSHVIFPSFPYFTLFSLVNFDFLRSWKLRHTHYNNEDDIQSIN